MDYGYIYVHNQWNEGGLFYGQANMVQHAHV